MRVFVLEKYPYLLINSKLMFLIRYFLKQVR
jgi:hypothetical protein